MRFVGRNGFNVAALGCVPSGISREWVATALSSRHSRVFLLAARGSWVAAASTSGTRVCSFGIQRFMDRDGFDVAALGCVPLASRGSWVASVSMVNRQHGKKVVLHLFVFLWEFSLRHSLEFPSPCPRVPGWKLMQTVLGSGTCRLNWPLLSGDFGRDIPRKETCTPSNKHTTNPAWKKPIPLGCFLRSSYGIFFSCGALAGQNRSEFLP